MMKIETFKYRTPNLSLESYFLGKTWAWGIFEDRFGRLRRSFQVNIQGQLVDGQLILDEDFIYDDHQTEKRIWRIQSKGDGHYQGKADDIIGEAKGQCAGNALNWKYKMDLPVGNSKLRVTFNDWMFLQPGDVMVNKAKVTKWGVHLGTAILFFTKQPPKR